MRPPLQLAGIAVSTVALFFIAAGIASANEPWPIVPLNPMDGGVYGITPPTADGRVGAVATEIQIPTALPLGTQAVMEISAANIPGQDGTLADDQLASIGTLYARDSDPSRFAGTVSAGAFQHPGTYYFQYHAQVLDRFDDGQTWCSNVPPGSSGLCLYVSPVFTFTINAPPPVPVRQPSPAPVFQLGQYTAVTSVKSYVKRRLKGRRIKATCTRDDPSQFTCRVRYIRKNKSRRATIEVYRDQYGIHYQRP